MMMMPGLKTKSVIFMLYVFFIITTTAENASKPSVDPVNKGTTLQPPISKRDSSTTHQPLHQKQGAQAQGQGQGQGASGQNSNKNEQEPGHKEQSGQEHGGSTSQKTNSQNQNVVTQPAQHAAGSTIGGQALNIQPQDNSARQKPDQKQDQNSETGGPSTAKQNQTTQKPIPKDMPPKKAPWRGNKVAGKTPGTQAQDNVQAAGQQHSKGLAKEMKSKSGVEAFSSSEKETENKGQTSNADPSTPVITAKDMKHVMLSAAMTIVGVALMLLIIMVTMSKRRRRRYKKCSGISDDCEMRSNFQLVNEDERLGIRTSSNYFL